MAAAVDRGSQSSGSAQRGWLNPPTSFASGTSDFSSSTYAATRFSTQAQDADGLQVAGDQLQFSSSRDQASSAHSALFASASVLGPVRSLYSAGFPQDNRESETRHGNAKIYDMALVPEARPDNDYLGFCRGAYNLQNGDRDAALQKAKEGGAYSRSGASSKTATAYYQKCKEPKCAFRSNFVSTDPNLLWSKTFEFPERALKLRWTFLAKSHVPQRPTMHNKHSYKCLFCVYQSAPEAAVYCGMEAYLDHVSSVHRGRNMDSVLLYKTRCLNDHIANDREAFDINLWPSTASKESMKVSEWLTDEFLDPAARKRKGTIDSVNSYYLTGIKPAEPVRKHDEDEGTDGMRDPSITAQADRLFAPSPQYKHIDPSLNPLAPTQTSSSGWDDPDGNPWAEAVPSRSRSHSGQQHSRASLEQYNSASIEQQLAESPTDMMSPVPQIPPRSQLRPLETVGIQQIQQSFAQTSIAGPPEESMNVCLGDIVQNYTEAIDILADMAQEAAQNLRVPPSPLLQFALSDAPSEILKLQQRGMGLFGPAFDSVDDSVVTALQRTSRQLYSGLIRPLRQAARDPNFNDYPALIQFAEHGQQTTVTILKQRLAILHASSGSGLQTPAVPSHSLRPPSLSYPGYSPAHSRASSQDIPRLSHLSDDSHSVADSERQPSTASTGSSSHPVPAGPATPESRRRSSMLGFLKHGIRSSSDSAPGQPRSEGGLSGMVKLDFRHRKHAEATYPSTQKAVELDSTPALQK
ncbi:hypothetical protein Slin14017_G093470 [Septoria linicola]|nr:hypothetical protein Slin14017_G093470 [Septoria linicola]